LLVTQGGGQHLGKRQRAQHQFGVEQRYPPGTVVYTGTRARWKPSRVLAVELGARRIRVNTISPAGWRPRALRISSTPDTGPPCSPRPLGRSGKPDDIGAVAVFLASNDSRWLTGSG